MKKVILGVMAVSIIMISTFGMFVCADEINPEVGDGIYDGYDLTSKLLTEDVYTGGNQVCWDYRRDEDGLFYMISEDLGNYNNYLLHGKIKVPDNINGREMSYILGSCYVGEFDLNPENKYMKCVDNVIFSRDEKQLMSYARYDERTEYVVPNGVEKVNERAFRYCDNLKTITLSDSVSEIGSFAFSKTNIETYCFSKNVTIIPIGCFNSNKNLTSFYFDKDSKLCEIKDAAFGNCTKLEEVYLPSFKVKIGKLAFGPEPKIKLKSYVQPKVSAEGNKIIWEEITNASYFEIYQKIGKDEYKLLKTTKKMSCEFPTLKSGKEYTFAVKPVAVIPSANFDEERDKGHYPEFPESFTIEGTMSEDIVLVG